MERLYAGQSQRSIAQEFDVHPKTVQRAVLRFYETDAKYPAGLDATQVELMRTEEFNSLEHAQQQLALAHAAMPEPKSFNEHAEKVKVTALAAATLCKISERKSALYGLNSVQPAAASSVTNNLMITGTTEVDYLKNLARLKELENGH